MVSAAQFSVAIYNGKFHTDLLLVNLVLCLTFYNIFPKNNFLINVYFFHIFCRYLLSTLTTYVKETNPALEKVLSIIKDLKGKLRRMTFQTEVNYTITKTCLLPFFITYNTEFLKVSLDSSFNSRASCRKERSPCNRDLNSNVKFRVSFHFSQSRHLSSI